MQSSPDYTGTLGEKPKILNRDGRDQMGLTQGQRTFAWFALAAGVIALVVALTYTPDRTSGYDAASDNRPNSSVNNGGR